MITWDRSGNWIATALLSLLLVLCLASMRFQTPTADEQNHISRGYHYLVTGNLDLNVAPPFVNMLSGVPLLFHKGTILPKYDPTHSKTYINEFADKFVWVNNDAEKVISLGRLAIVILSAVLGYFVFRWARELWGLQAGLVALFLYVLDPNILAHSQLVTTDLGVACLVFIATYFLWRFLRQRRNADLFVAGVLLGLAQATKLSALLLLPIFAVTIVIETVFLRDWTLQGCWPLKARVSQSKYLHAVYFGCMVLAVLLVIAFVAMWASYGFETAPLVPHRPTHATIDRFVSSAGVRELAYRVAESLPMPFPTYFRGVRWLQRYAERGAPAFLMGQYSSKGWWYYFLVAFAIKTPVPMLLLLAWAVYWAVHRGLEASRRDYVLFVPLVVFFGATLFSFLNIGYRHILPVLPFGFVLVSQVVTWARKRWAQAALVLLCLWYALASARIYPHYLAYFNELVGGPDNGYMYLVDSNLDWGQDLRNLKVYMDQHGIERVNLAYFGSAHVDYYGVQSQPLPPQKPDDLETRPSEVYAISATYLQSGYLGDTQAFAWLRAYRPFAKIGYSIFLYRLPRTHEGGS